MPDPLYAPAYARKPDGTVYIIGGGGGGGSTGGEGGLDQATADALYVNVSGDTMSGPLLLPAGDPPNDQAAATKIYVDTAIAAKLDQTTADARYINAAGDTLTGALNLASDPTANLEATPKQYVDQIVTVSTTPPEGVTPSRNGLIWFVV